MGLRASYGLCSGSLQTSLQVLLYKAIGKGYEGRPEVEEHCLGALVAGWGQCAPLPMLVWQLIRRWPFA